MQTLPQEVLGMIYAALPTKHRTSLGLVCQACYDYWKQSGLQSLCKQDVMRRLLALEVKRSRPHYLTLSLQPRRTQRLEEWLRTGTVTMQEFWEAAVEPVTIDQHLAETGVVLIAICERLPPRCVLNNEDVKFWKAQVKTLTMHVSPFRVVVRHTAMYPYHRTYSTYLTSRLAKYKTYMECAKTVDDYHMPLAEQDKLLLSRQK